MPPASGPTLSLGLIYYVIFRHKWKILIISILGVIAWAVFPLVSRLTYQSEAKLLIHYVRDNPSPTPTGPGDSKVVMTDRSDSIISTELEILRSLDVCRRVATNLGPDKILAKAGGGADLNQAAEYIHANLNAQAPWRSSVIQLVFAHPDPQMAQSILSELIGIYIQQHMAIHGTAEGFEDLLTQQTDQLRARLAQSQQELRRARSKVGILSVEDSKKAYSEQISKIRQEILDAEADLAERQAAMEEWIRAEAPKMSPAASNSAAEGTNAGAVAGQLPVTNSIFTNDLVVPPDKLNEYKRISGLLASLEKREEDLAPQVTGENTVLKSVRAQMSDAEKRKNELESRYPSLLSVKVSESRNPNVPVSPTKMDLTLQRTQIAGLESKIKRLNEQFEAIRTNVAAIDEAEGSISELQRKMDLDEQNYKYLVATQERTRIDETFGAGRAPNISIIQSPSPPFVDSSKRTKTRKMLLLGGFALAFGLAFALELFIDTSLKHPAQIEAKTGVPLFISIPLFGKNGKANLLKRAKGARLLPQTSAQNEAPADAGSEAEGKGNSLTTSSALVTANGSLQLPAWDPHHALRPFSDALRDRIITFFEVKNLTHKPKLVAVTSCDEGAGVSMVASGLAASLSETGEGNVLLVNMKEEDAPQQFYRGMLALGLDQALELEKRNEARVQEHLYVVSGAGSSDKLPQILPKRFKHLVPQLRASDYDYIIFDLPPIDQISITPRLARFMDMVLVVTEAEKTDLNHLKQALNYIPDPKPNLGLVLNKRQEYVPKRLSRSDLI